MPDAVTRSIDSLQRLYTIVVGLALTLALNGYLNPPPVQAAGIAPITEGWVLGHLLMMIVTIVPFYHGANRHLDAAHVFVPQGQIGPPPYTLMIDFFVLFAEGIFMVLIGLSLHNEERFLSYFIVLLTIDIVWAIFVWLAVAKCDGRKAVAKWFWINVAALVALYVVWKTPLLPETSRGVGVLAVASLRTLFDYVLCWKFYVPTR